MAKFDAKSFNEKAFGKYMSAIPNVKLNKLRESRAIVGDARLRNTFVNNSQTGTVYAVLPFFGLLSGTPQNYDGVDNVTPDRTDTFEQGVFTYGRMNGWTEADFSYDITGGTDFMANVRSQINDYWNSVDQDVILAILKGVFGMKDTGTGDIKKSNAAFVEAHTYDIAQAGAEHTDDTMKMDATTLNSAIQKACGDNKQKFKLVYCHSAVATNLENLKLLAYLKYTDAQGIERDLEMGTWNGRLVIIDDSLPTKVVEAVAETTLVSKVTRTNEVAIKIDAAYSNVDLKEGYYMRTLGLYAVDPDKGEILYAVCIEKSNNCYMPPYNGVTVSAAYLQLYTTVGNADNVSLAVSPGAYATVGDIQALEKEIADLKAFVGYSDGDIYGVEVDFENKKFTRLAGAVNRSAGSGFDGINAFGGRKRCNLTNDGRVAAYYGEAGFSTTGKLTQAVDRNPVGTESPDENLKFSAGTIVQVMVEQPKFYYKVVPLKTEKRTKGAITRKIRYYVSDTPKAGFKLHPAFIVNGQENDVAYLAAFEGSLWDASASAYILDDSQVADFAADMLCSIANAKPLSGLTQNATRGNIRKLAEKRGTGWEQGVVQTASASQMLMLIEYATFNMQSVIGNGAVSKTDDGKTSMTENTGATITLGNASGSVVNANGIQIVSYRGEENFWGNIWWWIDGINHYANATTGECETYVADHGFADDIKAAPYEDTGMTAKYGNGYISAFCYSEDFDWLFLPGEFNGNTALPVGDYCWNQNGTGWRVAILGASWNYGLSAGAFYWSLADASSTRYRYVGGRLVYRKKVAA